MHFIVDRKTWYRGHGPHKSSLLRSDNLRCCIGFVGQQCGVSDDSLSNQPGVACLERTTRAKFPVWMNTASAGPLFAAYRTNDDPGITDEDRERQLIKIFAEHGDTLEFINE